MACDFDHDNLVIEVDESEMNCVSTVSENGTDCERRHLCSAQLSTVKSTNDIT